MFEDIFLVIKLFLRIKKWLKFSSGMFYIKYIFLNNFNIFSINVVRVRRVDETVTALMLLLLR